MKSNNLLGQHFLISRRPVKLMIDAAKEEPPVDVVLEIGPGKGALTRALASEFPKVIAIEKDRTLAEELRRNLEIEKIRNCEIIAGDILKIDFKKIIAGKKYAVIANIPYYITSRIVRIFLSAGHQPEYMLLMMQKEVADRAIADSPKMNLLALSVQSYGKPKIIGRVSQKEFRPVPKVDSAIIKISDISRNFFTKHKIAERKFFELARAAFLHKRKILLNSLSAFYGNKKSAAAQIKKAGLDANARPEELSLEEWAALLKNSPAP